MESRPYARNSVYQKIQEAVLKGLDRACAALEDAKCPLVIVAMIAADHVVPLCLGDQWDDSVPIFRAMAPAAFIACTNVANRRTW